MEDKKLSKLKQEVESLNFKDIEDYKRFKVIDYYIRGKIATEMVLNEGKSECYKFIKDKYTTSFQNYYDYFDFDKKVRKHFSKYYQGVIFKNFEQENFMYNDMAIQRKRKLIM